MTKTTLPEKAMSALAEHMGIKDVESIADIRTNRVGDTYFLTVTLTREISQAELIGLTK